MKMAKQFSSITNPELIQMINSGAIGVIPTDTVYGLVGAANIEPAIKKLYSVKSRKRQPGTTIAASPSQLIALGFPADKVITGKKYWPNAISIEMSALGIPDYLSAGQQVMAARIPQHDELITLLNATGPLMTTSANKPDAPTSTTISQAIDYFGDEVDFYVDGGDLGNRPPSTIIGFNGDEIIVYRQGAVKI